MGLTAFILACIGLMCWWLPLFGQIIAVAGGVLGFLGIRRAAQIRAAGGHADNGLAIAGLVIAVLALVPATFFLLLALAVGGSPAVPPPDISLF